MLTLSRPAIVESDKTRLDAEYRSARWAHHRLLDFEDQHQRVLDEAAEAAAPGIVRVGRILARLARRAKRAARASEGTWCPNLRLELAETLKTRLAALRVVRNADPRWKVALGWADERTGEIVAPRRRRAIDPSKVKRRKTETDEAFAKRFALLTNDETDEHYKAKEGRRRTRRDQYRVDLYARSRVYSGTWNALLASVDQARSDVLKRRKLGLPAEWRRPKFRDPVSLAVDKIAMSGSGFRVVERGHLWWHLQMRLGKEEEWVAVRSKCGSWHALPEGVQFTTAKLTRRKDGERFKYNLSLTCEAAEKRTAWAKSGMVAFDWGHREFGHDNEHEGLRAFVWLGNDGQTGEVLVPRECRDVLDEIDAMKARVDLAFNARKAAFYLPDRNRYRYRRRLMVSGVRTAEELFWLRWEMRYERRIEARRKRIKNLRREVYVCAVRELRQRYATFVFEGESIASIKQKQKDEQMLRRKRQNRDLVTRYEFVSVCERFGAALVTVSARNTTRECPDCGTLAENGPELLMACPGCGRVRDKDHGARRVILRRGQEALANHAAG